MAGSLIKIDEEIVTSAVASVTLTGIDSTYDVYVFQYNNVQSATVNKYMALRFTESGTPNTSANYDRAGKVLKANTTFSNNYGTNGTFFYTHQNLFSTDAGQANNGTIYIFNANNASEYTFMTQDNVAVGASNLAWGNQGGGVFTVTSAVDGVHFYMEDTGNMDTGHFVLFGLRK